jgi:hypothetical protein
MKTCFACHEKAKVSDLVFTHYAPEAQNVYLADPPYGNGKCQKTGIEEHDHEDIYSGSGRVRGATDGHPLTLLVGEGEQCPACAWSQRSARRPIDENS